MEWKIKFGDWRGESELVDLCLDRKQAYWDGDMQKVEEITEQIEKMNPVKPPKNLKLTKKYNPDDYP